MALQVSSDLHLNRYKSQKLPKLKSLAIILAGDIAEGIKGLEYAKHVAEEHQKPVIYVPGNHEYYWHNYIDLQTEMRRFAKQTENVIFLDNDVFELEGIRFIGSTLWTDYELDGRYTASRVMDIVGRCLNDHRLIAYGLDGKFTTEHALALHRNARAFLERELNKPYIGKTVVITHHAPSLKCAHPHFAVDEIAGAFISDMDDLIKKADLWIYGHTHANLDIHVGKCRLVSNQLGYSSERLPAEYRPNLLIEV
jgi:predicted phosphodiesterase